MKWEYRVLYEGRHWRHSVTHSALEPLLNQLGEEGWEVVTCHGTQDGRIERVILKRPKEEPAPTS